MQPLTEFYNSLHDEKRGVKGAVMIETDVENGFVDALCQSFTAVQTTEVLRPFVYHGVQSKSGCTEYEVHLYFFEELLKSGMMKCVNESVLMGFSAGSELSAHTLLYHPNENFTDFEKLKQVGRFLSKCIQDGKIIPPVFAPSLYKYISGRTISLEDLEAYDPNTALKLRYSITQGQSVEEVEAKVQEILVTRIGSQLSAIKEGFLDFDMTKLLENFSGFELEMVSLTPAFNDGLSPESLRKIITFSEFPESSETPNHFWRYLDSLSTYSLRMFLYFATSRCTLAHDATSVSSSAEEQMFAQDNLKILVHAVDGSASMTVLRTFAFQIDLPDYSDFMLLSYALTNAMLKAARA